MTTPPATTHTVFSGIQPTGSIHIGNYIGAVQNWIRLQALHRSFFCIVDYHAITTPWEPAAMPRRILEVAADLLAAGIDPEQSTFFVQSQVPQATELCWVLNTLAPMGALERMTQYKEKSGQFRESVALFDYPVLQAADVLLYKADLVPVGEDQLQHLELARELARKFNRGFGDTFPEPQAALTRAPRVMALNDPTRKMSKSLPGSFIALTDSDDEIRVKIGRAVTDVGPRPGEMGPGVANLFVLLEAFAPAAVVRHFADQYAAGTLRYADLKPPVAEAVIGALAPIRDRRRALLADRACVAKTLRAGAERARAIADATMREVKAAMGLSFPD